eukprot:GHVU01048462.1.p1 GENE.GHVU01048462.1~~GHVU01048462.1.p1  ORF type:complete len:103 (+),score=6.81 GHVU01048462.1:1181-1489(+)
MALVRWSSLNMNANLYFHHGRESKLQTATPLDFFLGKNKKQCVFFSRRPVSRRRRKTPRNAPPNPLQKHKQQEENMNDNFKGPQVAVSSLKYMTHEIMYCSI